MRRVVRIGVEVFLPSSSIQADLFAEIKWLMQCASDRCVIRLLFSFIFDSFRGLVLFSVAVLFTPSSCQTYLSISVRCAALLVHQLCSYCLSLTIPSSYCSRSLNRSFTFPSRESVYALTPVIFLHAGVLTLFFGYGQTAMGTAGRVKR
ncbi:hypothetical protein C8J57DRAFT_413954 [Mycena rebaudengoi]|nr:hypothetical protein C8J57DRAFT_413954 [Mycena rebaudengoi]